MRRFLIISFFALLLISLVVIFYPRGDKGAQFGQVKLPENVKELLVGKWEWKSTIDPFDNSNKRIAEKEGEKYLLINSDGSFTEWSKEESRAGNWILNKKKTAVAFLYDDENTRNSRASASLLAYEYRHRIKSIDKNGLVLGIQGRHGIVQEAYEAVSDSAWNVMFPESK
ncbi:MAG: hypothetical protein MRZ79_14415 [Bacteroidia bacterium]|nr:hypothetical protein [Bacteroidia bacterium]